MEITTYNPVDGTQIAVAGTRASVIVYPGDCTGRIGVTNFVNAAVSGGSVAHVFVDGRERALYTAADGAGTGGEFVILYDLGSGTHTLSLALEGPTEGSPSLAGSSATISGFANRIGCPLA